MRKLLAGLIGLSLLLGLCGAGYAADTLNNDAVIEMHKLGLGDTVIIEKIKAGPCAFDTSLDGLKKLKAAGLSEGVIAAMVSAGASRGGSKLPAGDPNDPKAAHDAGIYLYEEVDGKPKMTRVDGSMFSEVKTGSGWGVGWGGTAKQRAVLEGVKSATIVKPGRPVFYFYFEETKASLSKADGARTNPSEFELVQLEVKKDKNERRLVIGKVNLGGAKSGLDRKTIREFESESIAEGVFKVVPKVDLTPGEYAFVYDSTAPASALGGGGRAFDFSVGAP